MHLPLSCVGLLLLSALLGAADRFGQIVPGTWLQVHDEVPIARWSSQVWKQPGYTWLGGKAVAGAEAGDSTVGFDIGPGAGTVDIAWQVRASTTGGAEVTWRAQASADAPLGACAILIQPLSGTACTLIDADGTSTLLASPIPSGYRAAVVRIVLKPADAPAVRIDFPSPVAVWHHDNLRLLLNPRDAVMRAGAAPPVTARIAGPIDVLPDSASLSSTDTSTWFPWTPANVPEQGAIGMGGWFAPIHEPVTIVDDHFEAGGQRIRLWGVQHEYADNAPTAAAAAKRVAFYSKHGCSYIRLFGIGGRGWAGLAVEKGAWALDPVKAADFDRYVGLLADAGIRYAFSPLWHLPVSPEERGRAIAYDELPADGPNRKITDAIWLDEGLQDHHISVLTSFLTRVNPRLGTPYAVDPALASIEIQNEASAFWYTFSGYLQEAKTYRAVAAKRFCAWLRQRYGDAAGLAKAWGGAGLAGFPEFGAQSLDADTIVPAGNPWFWDTQRQGHPLRARHRDTVLFLDGLQRAFYRKAEAAIRATGFRGAIVASNWQGGEDLGHLLNLAADAETGTVDRHNYTGGVGSWAASAGQTVDLGSGLDHPGSGLLSMGFNQVAGKPFILSEWCCIPPDPWAAGDSVIVAAYGMGLQGWSAASQHAANGDGYSGSLWFPGTKVHNVLTPAYIGLYPVLSRMVLRGDIAAGPVVSRRSVTRAQLEADQVPFRERASSGGDVKGYASANAPGATLAIGRALVDFAAAPAAEVVPALPAAGAELVSATGQLRWHATGAPHQGWIAIDTAGTQGLAGWAPGSVHRFGDLDITPSGGFGVILATAASPNGTLADDSRLIIAAVARTTNTGLRIWASTLLDPGKAPVLVEPVRARLAFRHPVAAMQILDQDGRRTGRTLPAGADGAYAIDTGRDGSIWYEVERVPARP